MTIFTLQRVAYTRSFNRCKYDIEDVGGICERARHNGSLVRSGTLLLVKTRLGFQTRRVIEEKIGFKTISN